MRLYNTMSREVEEVRPSDGTVRIYLCGVTVYDYSHIGHARTIIVFDVLRRYLIHRGYNVKFVQNFTDVDDKIIRAAREKGVRPLELAEYFIEQYFNDFDRLNVLRADHYPRATEHIGDMHALIKGLMDKGYAYTTSKGVYFSIVRDADYGKLSKKPIDELKAGARVEVDEEKLDPLDFALWKFAEDEPSWDSPWGRGRPGWHIECSAMSMKYLGETFEIHGGGEDLIFPHHENEIAQSESLTCKEFARHWVHVGMVNVRGEKMAKSLKNIEPIRSALSRWGPNAIRLYCLSAHYRKPLEYDESLLRQALAVWRDVENALFELEHAMQVPADEGSRVADELRAIVDDSFSTFMESMDDDLDTPRAIASLLVPIRAVNRYAAEDMLDGSIAGAVMKRLNDMLFILGLRRADVSMEERARIEEMVRRRSMLRAEKRYREADEIREMLRAEGVELVDHRDRTVWKKLG
ncbi:MAG: cysteine--tRNA ligase [Candidatus Nitrosocaldus sp.]|nr:cysteine--tRNA ligase [Candidatus Nitrosocaldus sp.]MDW7999611.1 cysteine--tRNA ligase [Candidatus Nitrosocaldus sp.]